MYKSKKAPVYSVIFLTFSEMVLPPHGGCHKSLHGKLFAYSGSPHEWDNFLHFSALFPPSLA